MQGERRDHCVVAQRVEVYEERCQRLYWFVHFVMFYPFVLVV